MLLFPELNDDMSLAGERPANYADAELSYTCIACDEAFPPDGVFYSCANYDENGLMLWVDGVVTFCDTCIRQALERRNALSVAA